MRWIHFNNYKYLYRNATWPHCYHFEIDYSNLNYGKKREKCSVHFGKISVLNLLLNLMLLDRAKLVVKEKAPNISSIHIIRG